MASHQVVKCFQRCFPINRLTACEKFLPIGLQFSWITLTGIQDILLFFVVIISWNGKIRMSQGLVMDGFCN